MDRIYLDYAATTPLKSEVYKEMLSVYNEDFGNSSSLHSFGRDASAKLEHARSVIAEAINADTSEIYFTSGGSESNNWAIMGLARANKSKGNHIIISAIEHHSVLESAKALQNEGFEVSLCPVDKFGIIKYKELVKLIRPTTILISVMTVNNEVGSIQPLKAIAKLAETYGICFHSDAVQAIGTVKIDVKDIGLTALSLTAHKIYGPIGIGALYIKKGTKIEKLIYGGEQERNMRAGTSNVPLAVGFAKAVEIATKNLEQNTKYFTMLRKYFVHALAEKVKTFVINGNPTKSVPNILNISFQNIDGDAILMMLDLAGIAVSTGAACASGVAKSSHVLDAMNTKRKKNSSIRISFGVDTTKSELDVVASKLAEVVGNLRKASPVKIKAEAPSKKGE